MNFTSQKPHYESLRKKWMLKHRKIQDTFWEKHGDSLKHLAVGSLGGLMLLAYPSNNLKLPLHSLSASRDDILKDYDQNVLLAQILSEKMPEEVRPLQPLEEKEIINILNDNFRFNVKAEIEGIRLNRNYGLIGGEQHLYRYPGDNLYAHAENASDYAMFGDAGIAPGLGAWGYFASSKEYSDKLKERYYLAIQTFLAPGFAENFGRYRDFFKFRKMLVINPKTGQAVVAVIGDAGPAEWTGKHLGGSPEVMETLGFATGPRKGEALYFFVDDPKDKIPLGPIKTRMEI